MKKWTELRTAYQVAKLGTVSAAAEALDVHRSTVIRHIDVIEAEFGTKIFRRHTRGNTPTEIGKDMLRVAERTQASFDDLLGRTRVGLSKVAGAITVTVAEPLASTPSRA